MLKLMLYGLHRTGTNYAQKIIEKNFSDINFLNDGYARSLPVHKHFRLYKEQYYIPEPCYFNNFHYSSLAELEEHITRLTNARHVNFIVTVRNPFSWYLSYCKMARRYARWWRKNKWINFQKNRLNPHYMIDYNLFYSKWTDFYRHNPDRIFLIRQEDILQDMKMIMNRLKDKFNLKLKPHKKKGFKDTKKVYMSKQFTEKKRSAYLSKTFLNKYSKQDLMILNEHLNQAMLKQLGYTLNLDKIL
ncbi:MAG TPA: sulfotransferase [Spirochaetota bacterium]|nr:sulfotransferase [Spirochaetota bacterium]